MPEADKFSGTTFAGCTIKEKIGQGGMGSVYLARHEALARNVAVKILSPDLAREERNVEFFLREARSAAKLEHPNIVQIYNFGQENGSYFIIMSCIEGKSLADVIAEKGPMDTDTATGIILEVLAGLGHAHSKTIIHRDIKPSNILLGTDGHPRIVDFGLARSISEEKQLTMAGEMVGTAYFMSPEQGLAGKVDHRADLYSTGATFFYLLTGKYPFEGKSSIEVIHKHIGEPFPNILIIKPDVALWVSHVLDRLMRKKPESRYQSAAEVIEDIKRRKTAEENGLSVSDERAIELPDVTARLGAGAPAAPAAAPAAPAPRREPAKFKKLQFPELHNSIKAATHLSITSAAVGCFLLAGSAGTPKPDLASSLLSPLAANPTGAGVLLAAGLGLIVWSIRLKPLKFTSMHAFFSAAAALTAYTGAVYAPSPGTADMVSKAFFFLKTAVENILSPSNQLICALFLYIAASKLVFKRHWAAKAGAVAAYGLSLLLTYVCFKAGARISPEKNYLITAGVAAAAGLLAALTQKRFSIIFNPALLFLAANGVIFAMFTNPWINEITAKKVSADALRVETFKRQAYYEYRQELAAQEAAAQEFDVDGRPIARKPVAPPQETSPTPRGELDRAARLEYYLLLASQLKNSLLSTAGLVLIALCLLFITNICFLEELFARADEGLNFIGFNKKAGGAK